MQVLRYHLRLPDPLPIENSKKVVGSLEVKHVFGTISLSGELSVPFYVP